MASLFGKSLSVSVSIAIFLLLVSFTLDSFNIYQLGLYILYGIGAQSVAFCWGRVGILSFGHSLFFGVGAYLAGNLMIAFGAHPVQLHLLLLLSGLVPAILALCIALVLFTGKYESGPYFSLTTLALALLAYQASFIFAGYTGGYDGLSGGVELPGWDPYGDLFYLILALLAVSTFTFAYLSFGPIGIVLKALADNENRLQFFGFDTPKIKALAFAVSAFFTGLAGALFAAHEGIVSPQILGVIFATELVIWSAIGGRTSIVFPVFAAIAIGLFSAKMRAVSDYWELIVAAIFIIAVIFFPQGFVGFVQRLVPRFMPRLVEFGQKAGRRAAIDRSPPLSATPAARMRSLKFRNVNVRVGNIAILSTLNLGWEDASGNADEFGDAITCLIGPNGAGKTSLFNAMTCRLAVSTGEILFNGTSVTGNSAFAMSRIGVGRKFQIPTVFSTLSVRDNILVALWSNRISAWGLLSSSPMTWRSSFLVEQEQNFPFLCEPDRMAGNLSQGDKQKLEILMTILGAPAVILMDEPCAGLSLTETTQVTDLLADVAKRFGIRFIIVEHDMSLVERIAHRVFVLHQGALLAEGTFESVRNNSAVQSVYAGGVK